MSQFHTVCSLITTSGYLRICFGTAETHFKKTKNTQHSIYFFNVTGHHWGNAVILLAYYRLHCLTLEGKNVSVEINAVQLEVIDIIKRLALIQNKIYMIFARFIHWGKCSKTFRSNTHTCLHMTDN